MMLALLGVSPAFGYIVEDWRPYAVYQAENWDDHQAGQRVQDSKAAGGAAWSSGTESSGKYLLLGDTAKIAPGRYHLSYRLKLDGKADGDLGKMDIYDREGEKLPALTIRAKDFPKTGAYKDFTIDFDWEYGDRPLEFRYECMSAAEVRIDQVKLVRRAGWLEVGFDSKPPALGQVYGGRTSLWARALLPDTDAMPQLRVTVYGGGMAPAEFTGTPKKTDERVHLVDLGQYRKNVKLTVEALDPSGKAVFTWKGDRKLELPHPAKLALSFPIKFVMNDDHTYYFVKIGDLDGNGRPDYLISRGTVQQEAHDADGRLLWEYEDPKANYKDIRADSDVRIYDIDGDGASEAIVARSIDGVVHLCIVDGKTGEIKHKIPYPGIDKRKDRSSINIANLTGKSRASEILVSWDYTYLAAFDSQLNLLWEGPADMGQHTPKVADIDGDGKDEVICSTELLDHNGKLIWSQRDFPTIRSISMGSYKRDDVDSPQIAEIDGNPSNGPEVFFSTGGTLLDRTGKPIWSLGEMIFHGQHADVGHVFPGKNGVRIVLVDWRDRGMYNAPRAILLIDPRGHVEWSKQSSWATMGDWDGDGLDEVFLGEGYVVNGRGDVLSEVPDFFSNVMICDVMGDARAEFILPRINMRDHTAQLEVYTNTSVNRNRATNMVTKAKEITKRVLNWTCY